MQQIYSISSSGKARRVKNREQLNRQQTGSYRRGGVGGVTRELGYVGIRVGGGVRTIRSLLCVPLQILKLNERTPQLFAILVFNAPPETSHVLLHSLQLKERRHTSPPELPG